MQRKGIDPPFFFMIAVGTELILHYAVPIKQVIPSPYRYLGLLPTVYGTMLNLWADGLFKRYRTTVKPFDKSTKLIVEGPFQFSRNPMYVGMVAILMGLAVLLGSITPFVPVVVMFFILQVLYIPHEEHLLYLTFGNDFIEYRNITPKWINFYRMFVRKRKQ